MKALVAFTGVFFMFYSAFGQKDNLVVRYDFTDKSSPPMKVFYLRVYVDNILKDSTKPHKPVFTGNLSFENDAHLIVSEGCHAIRIEGIVGDKIDGVEQLVTVLVWSTELKVEKDKARVKLKLNENYIVESSTITESCEPVHEIMKLDSSLTANSKKVPLKFKSAISVGQSSMEKFKFGNYNVVKTKSEYESSLSKSKWFSRKQSQESKKIGFQMSCENDKTIDANLSVLADEQGFVENYLQLNDRSFLRKNELSAKDQLLSRHSTLIHYGGDSSDWAMLFVSYVPENKPNEPKRFGFLTNDSLLIEITEVKVWEGDEQHESYSPIGFQFYFGGTAIAAVQTIDDFFIKKYAWFRNDIDPYVKNIVAGAMAALYYFKF